MADSFIDDCVWMPLLGTGKLTEIMSYILHTHPVFLRRIELSGKTGCQKVKAACFQAGDRLKLENLFEDGIVAFLI